MPEHVKSAFVKAFGKRKQRVLWKVKSEINDGLPSNVKILTWAPQQDILGTDSKFSSSESLLVWWGSVHSICQWVLVYENW